MSYVGESPKAAQVGLIVTQEQMTSWDFGLKIRIAPLDSIDLVGKSKLGVLVSSAAAQAAQPE